MRVNANLGLAIVLALPFALVACGDEAAPEGQAPAELGGEVAGDVLGGTISDDMLPLDALTSQSPPAERPAEGDDDGDEAGADQEGATEEGATP
ncbi:MAG: hypothetical protein WBA51_07625 [Erythrobacter sp.]